MLQLSYTRQKNLKSCKMTPLQTIEYSKIMKMLLHISAYLYKPSSCRKLWNTFQVTCKTYRIRFSQFSPFFNFRLMHFVVSSRVFFLFKISTTLSEQRFSERFCNVITLPLTSQSCFVYITTQLACPNIFEDTHQVPYRNIFVNKFPFFPRIFRQTS